MFAGRNSVAAAIMKKYGYREGQGKLCLSYHGSQLDVDGAMWYSGFCGLEGLGFVAVVGAEEMHCTVQCLVPFNI